MPDFFDFLPLFQRTESDIRLQLNADMNEGLAATDPEWFDTREGGPWHILSQPLVQELARAWDEMTTQAAVGFIPFAFGVYLDYHGETLDVPRHDAIKATGEVTFTGTNGTFIASGTEVSPTQIDPDIDVPVFVTTESGTIAGGVLTVNVEAVEAGTAGNVSADAIDTVGSPIPGGTVSEVENAAAILGGADPETDESYLSRILEELAGQGPGNVADYKRWSREYPGVGTVTVIPVATGPGTVKVVIGDLNSDPLSGAIITGLQNELDPAPVGQGHGKAPIGAQVTVQTVAPVAVNVTAAVTFRTGYSLDGTGGTIATRAAIQQALSDYIDNLDVGDDVIKNHVEAQFFTVEGVLNVTVTVPAGDTTINDATNQVATTGVITLT